MHLVMVCGFTSASHLHTSSLESLRLGWRAARNTKMLAAYWMLLLPIYASPAQEPVQRAEPGPLCGTKYIHWLLTIQSGVTKGDLKPREEVDGAQSFMHH